MSWHRNARIATAVVTALAATAVLLDMDGPFRFVTVLTFLLVGPGCAWSLRMRPSDPLDMLVVGVALSVSSAALLAGSMALADWWRPGAAFALLVLLTATGLLLPLRTVPEVRDAGTQLDQTRT